MTEYVTAKCSWQSWAPCLMSRPAPATTVRMVAIVVPLEGTHRVLSPQVHDRFRNLGLQAQLQKILFTAVYHETFHGGLEDRQAY